MSKVHRHELTTHLEDYDDTRMGLDPFDMDDNASDDYLLLEYYDHLEDEDDYDDWATEVFDPFFYDFDEEIQYR